MARRAPQFFKAVIYPPEEGLKIPVKFMEKWGGDLQETVFLKVPNGVSWQVELANRDGRTLLKKGWEEFAEFYSIKQCYFLLFRYEGNSQFHVIIFDHSTTEIDYPEKLMEEEEISVVMRRTRATIDDDEAKDEVTPYERAKAFRSQKPFFILEVYPSYVSPPFNISIPVAFVKKHLTCKGNECELALLVGGKQEEAWAVICKVYPHSKCGARIAGCGWKKFVEDNSLKKGDFCVFELEWTNVFNVIIFRD